jgi:hypothetical protein
MSMKILKMFFIMRLVPVFNNFVHLTMFLYTGTGTYFEDSVLDPDPHWIFIQLAPGSGFIFGIRIRILKRYKKLK